MTSAPPSFPSKDEDDWHTQALGALIEAARCRLGLSLRDAEERAKERGYKLLYTQFSFPRASRAHTPRTNQALAATLDLDLDLLEVRSGRLPDDLKSDLSFQNAVYQLVCRWRAETTKSPK